MSLLDGDSPSKESVHQVHESLDRIEEITVKTRSPVFIKAVKTTWYDLAADGNKEARTIDLAFHMLRRKGVIRSGWTGFNQSNQRRVRM